MTLTNLFFNMAVGISVFYLKKSSKKAQKITSCAIL